MPTLSRPAFPIGFEPKREPTLLAPYDELPWTNAYWCHLQGFTSVGDGLDSRFTNEVWNKFTPSQREKFSSSNRQKAREFVLEIQQRWRENPKTYMMGHNKIPGFPEFRAAMKVLVDRPGGIHDSIWSAMIAKHATPADALRDLRINMERKGQPFDEAKAECPKSDTYFSSVRTHMARCLFGDEAINPRSGSVMDEYATALLALFSRTWEGKKVPLQKLLADRADLPQNFAKVMQGKLHFNSMWRLINSYSTIAVKHKPSVKNLMDASKTLSAWKQIADVTGEADSEAFKTREGELTELWKSVGRSRGKRGEVKRTKAQIQVLCSQEELDAAYLHYLQLHFPQSDILDAILDGVDSEPRETEPLIIELGTDLGVEDMLGITVPELVQMAGLPVGSTQFPFAEPGTTVDPDSQDDEGAVQKAPITPQWHQWVGALCLVRAWYTSELGGHPSPTILADDVGLGKTLQLVGSICILVHYMEHQSRGLNPPPLLSSKAKKYFAGLQTIPSLPHLLLIPRALSAQWHEEVQRYTEHGAFQVIIYSRNIQSRHEYFKPGGIWDQTVTNSKARHRTIIIAEVTSIAKEAEECLGRQVRDKASIRRAEPQQLIPDCGPTIFDKSFTVGIVDEIHNLRNVNMAWEGALKLLDNCAVRVGASATPICTGYNDILSALRLLRHAPLIGDQGLAQGDLMDKLEKEARLKWQDPSRVQKFAELMAQKRLKVVGSEPVSESTVQDTANLILNTEKRNLRPFFIAYPTITHVKALLNSLIIRRDRHSLDPAGEKVVTLASFIESIAYVLLDESEREALEQIKKRMPTALAGKAGEIAWINFLLDYRFLTFHKMMLDRENLGHPWEKWSKEDYERESSAKLRAMVMILQHHRADKDALPLMFQREDGATVPSTHTDMPVTTRPRKFIIFALYQLPRLLITKVLELHGIKYQEYDGTMTGKARNQALKAFDTDEEISVLLMSNVGAVGLNITRASVVIFVDQPWSHSEVMQIIGRAWRKGQQDQVIVYRLIARDTADETMSGYANGKALMLEQLTGNEQLLDCIHGRDEATLAEADDEEIEPPLKSGRKKTASKVKPRALKPVRKIVSESESDQESIAPAPGSSTQPVSKPSKATTSTAHKGKGKEDAGIAQPNVPKPSASTAQSASIYDLSLPPPHAPNIALPTLPSQASGSTPANLPSSPAYTEPNQVQGFFKSLSAAQIASNPEILHILANAGLHITANPPPDPPHVPAAVQPPSSSAVSHTVYDSMLQSDAPDEDIASHATGSSPPPSPPSSMGTRMDSSPSPPPFAEVVSASYRLGSLNKRGPTAPSTSSKLLDGRAAIAPPAVLAHRAANLKRKADGNPSTAGIDIRPRQSVRHADLSFSEETQDQLELLRTRKFVRGGHR